MTTDTTAAMRGLELGCDIVMKATRVDGIYSDDPEKNSHLRQTPITDRGIEILSQSKNIKDLIVDGPEISIDTMQRFFDSR